MHRNVLAPILIAVFFGLPLVLAFQNCAGGGGSYRVQVPQALFVVGQAPKKVSGAMIAGGDVDVVNFDITADSSRVVFMADRETDGKIELYAVHPDGDGLVKLSGGGKVESFRLAGSVAVYLAEETPGVHELFSVNTDGTGRVNLSGVLPAGGQVSEFELSPDLLRAVFLADKRAVGIPELFSVMLVSPGTPTQLHPDLASDRIISSFKPLNAHVLIAGSLAAAGPDRLFATGYDGSGFIAISEPGRAGGDGVVKFESNPSGSVIIYLGDLETAGKKELYRTDVSAGVQGKLSPASASGQVHDFALAGADHVVYLADLETPGKNELYQRDVAGPAAAAKLNPPLVTNGNVVRFTTFVRSVLVSGAPVLVPGVAFAADVQVDDKFELYAAPDFAAAAVKVSGTMASSGDVFDFEMSADGQSLAYVADQEVDGRFELFVSKMDGLPAKQLAAGAAEQDIVPPIQFLPDNQRVLFVGDLEKQYQRQLYVSMPSDALRLISRAKAKETDVYAFKVSPDGKWVIFSGDQDKEGVDELFVGRIPDP